MTADIKNFLREYCTSKHPQKGAVMLNGAWGSGKTFLVKEFIKENPSLKFIYVSLFGVNSFRQVEDAFFQQIHPVLSSKGMRIASLILKGMVRTTFKIDLDRDGREDGTIASQVPDINIPEYFSGVDSRILIFDDLERCVLPIKDIMGYINVLVEHDSTKVLLIANEKEIAIDQINQYHLFKEKLIAKTFDVNVSVKGVFSHLLASNSDVTTKKYFIKHASLFIDIFDQSETKNFRALQQTFWDLERLFIKIPEKYLDNNEFIKTLVGFIVALSLEFKASRIKIDDISNLGQNRWMWRSRKKENSEPSIIEKLQDRYPSINLDDPPLNYFMLANFIGGGLIDLKEIAKFLDESPMFSEGVFEPSWSVVWHSSERSLEKVEAAVLALQDDLNNKIFKREGEILHVLGIKLWLSRIEYISESQENVVLEIKNYIDNVICTEEFEFMLVSLNDFSRHHETGWGSLGFKERDSIFFLEVWNHLRKKQIELTEKYYPEQAKILEQEMLDDTDLFLIRLAFLNESDGSLYRSPILLHLDPLNFARKFLQLGSVHHKSFFIAFKLRFDTAAALENPEAEKEWLKLFVKSLREEIKTISPIKRSNIEDRISYYLDPFFK